MTEFIRFTSLELHGWRQFNNVSVQLHPRLTVLTGSNGAGKSTILNIFTQHFGFGRPYLSTPRRRKSGGYLYDTGIERDLSAIVEPDLFEESSSSVDNGLTDVASPRTEIPNDQREIGEIRYSNDVSAKITVPEGDTSQYGLSISPQQQVRGVHVSSHRGQFAYQPVNTFTAEPLFPAQAFAQFNSELVTKFQGGHTGYSPTYRLKEALISMAVFGEGNSSVPKNNEIWKAYLGFIARLRVVLPPEIGFQNLLIRMPDIILQTQSGEFILDSSSGGLNAIIEMTWQIHLYSLAQPDFVISIDEPENHLHPSMQRAVIPNLMVAFPEAQFIVATHSPFIVSAVEDSYVYVLNYTGSAPNRVANDAAKDRSRRVQSIKLDNVHKGGTASEILREVLGVPVTIPDWAQAKISGIVDEYRSLPFNNENLNRLRSDLAKSGFGELYPDALSQLVKSFDQAQ